ncbi:MULTISPECIES: acyl-CoA thioesterase [unclassified Brevundimonas]|uniref:acyl-CoA thioesterase n=1 Tax=unclassified Brevundimonas TaxID=2622653 RepID=UPI0025BF4D00|nr:MULTISPECIES: acyl-CoA thioesterase II [unclassified Brevundimonas]
MTELPSPKDPSSPSAPARVDALVELLTVETLDTDLYRGIPLPGGKGRVYGGQVVAQALQAAQQTVEGGTCHSLHCYFMRPGQEGRPIIYRVARDHDGRTFSTRRVIASQGGEPILNMLLSFQVPETGFEHQDRMPAVPAPEELVPEIDLWRAVADHLPDSLRDYALRPRSIEFRHVYVRNPLAPTPEEPRHASWFRTASALGDDAAMHRAVLAYASDMTLLSTCGLPHAVSFFDPAYQVASLDHAIWFHNDFRADDWLLYVTDSPSASCGRGFNRGQIFTRDGKLVASVAQEGLIRKRGSK